MAMPTLLLPPACLSRCTGVEDSPTPIGTCSKLLRALTHNLHALLMAIPQLEEDGVTDKGDPAVLLHKSALNIYVYFIATLYERCCKLRAQRPAEPGEDAGGMEHVPAENTCPTFRRMAAVRPRVRALGTPPGLPCLRAVQTEAAVWWCLSAGKKGRGKGSKKAAGSGAGADAEEPGLEFLGTQQAVMAVLAQALKAHTDVLFRSPAIERARMVDVIVQAVRRGQAAANH